MATDTPLTSNERVDSTERYYAEMEAARNTAMDAYFIARPQILRTHALESIFRAGFERAFAMMWAASTAVKEVTPVETTEELERLRKLEDHVERVACWVNPQDVYLEIRRTRDDIYNAREERRRIARSPAEPTPSLLKPAFRATASTPEAVARGAEILRSLKERPTRWPHSCDCWRHENQVCDICQGVWDGHKIRDRLPEKASGDHYCICGKSQLAKSQHGYYCKGCGKDLHPDNYLPENGKGEL